MSRCLILLLRAAVSRRALAILAIAVTVFLGGSSSAAAADATPPTPLAPPTAPYPPGETESAEVVVGIVVERDGQISHPEIIEGREPFASASLAATSTWSFAPAARDGTPLRARIRVRVVFTPPEPVSAPVPDPPATLGVALPVPSASPAPPPSPPVEDVSVRAPPAEVGRTSLTAEDIRTLPGAFGEPARVVESLPGVAAYASGLPFYSVRGAMPSNTTYSLDGMRLPLFFHYGLGVTTLHPGLVESVDLYTGAPPARDGRAFNVVEVTSRAPSRELRAEATVRAIDSSALLEAPLFDGRGDVLVSGRYGYPQPIVRLLNPKARLEYANLQLRTTWNIDDRQSLTLLALGVRDVFETDEGGLTSALTTVDSTVLRLDLRYDVRIGSTGHARVALTAGRDELATFGTTSGTFGGRASIELPVGDSLRVRAGGDVMVSTFSLESSFTNVELGDDRFLQKAIVDGLGGGATMRTSSGVWADTVVRLAPRIDLVPGVRVDRFDGRYASVNEDKVNIATTRVSPSLHARVGITPDLDFVASMGTASKEPGAAFPSPASEYLTRVTARDVQSATMLDAGFEARLPGGNWVRAVAFENGYRNMNLFPICPATDVCHADGTAHGAEIMLRRALARRLSGWITYTFTRARLHAPGVGDFEDPFERQHVVNAVARYDFGAGISAGARLVFYTGAPFVTTTTFLWNGQPFVQEVDTSTERPPPFWRLDARIEKRWTIGEHASVAVALEWLNATLNRETENVCRITDERRCARSQRPLLSAPSISLEGRL